jgi:hypothetical protein
LKKSGVKKQAVAYTNNGLLFSTKRRTPNPKGQILSILNIWHSKKATLQRQ